MKVSWLGAGAVVHAGDEPSSGATSLVVSPHGSTECAVVVSSHTVKLTTPMVEELAEVLANGLPRGFTAMRFVAWDGACATNDRPAAAHLLSMRLGIDVIAAAGPLLGVPGGSLFAPMGRGERRPGGFWRFRAGVKPVRVGWRFPAPHWEADLGEVPELPGDLVLEHIPAGLWLHRRSVNSVTDLAYSVPTDPAHPTLILSHPGEAPLHRDELAHGISGIPALAADRCVFTPYGQSPLADGQVGPVVSDILGRAVHVRTGLPLCAPAGQRAVVTIDDKGLPRWRTFCRELWHAPRTGAPRPIDWINPAPDLLTVPAGAATFALGSGWVLEVIEAGLWMRPEHLNEPADWIRQLPVDVNRCAIVVGAPHAAEVTPPGHMIAGVLEKMPIDARKRAYIAVPRGAAPGTFVLGTSLRDSLPEPGEVELIAPTVLPPPAAMPAYPPTLANTGGFPAVSSSGGFPTVSGSGGFPAVSGSGGFPAVSGSGGYAAVPATDSLPPATSTGSFPAVNGTGSFASVNSTGSVPVVPHTGAFPAVTHSTGGQPHVSQPRSYQREAPAEHRLDAPPPRYEEPPTVHMSVPRVPVLDEPLVVHDEPPAEESATNLTGREIRSHSKKGKQAKRDDDATSTKELDRLLGFFDEIRRAKAWDESDPGSPEHQAARQAAAAHNAGGGRH